MARNLSDISISEDSNFNNNEPVTGSLIEALCVMGGGLFGAGAGLALAVLGKEALRGIGPIVYENISNMVNYIK